MTGERGQARADRAARAKSLCAQCAVTAACLAQSVLLHEEYGIWGGLTETERAAPRSSTIRGEVCADGA